MLRNAVWSGVRRIPRPVLTFAISILSNKLLVLERSDSSVPAEASRVEIALLRVSFLVKVLACKPPSTPHEGGGNGFHSQIVTSYPID